MANSALKFSLLIHQKNKWIKNKITTLSHLLSPEQSLVHPHLQLQTQQFLY